MAKREIPEINAGSMADIAFLLLIFFLVTTTMDKDKAYIRHIPKKIEINTPDPVEVEKRNICQIKANFKNELMFRGQVMRDPDQISEKVIEFYTKNRAQNDVTNNFPMYSRITKEEINAAYDKAIEDLEATEAQPNAMPEIIEFKQTLADKWSKKREALELYGKDKLPEIHFQTHVRIEVQKETDYVLFAKIQSELEEAFYEMRNDVALDVFGESYGAIKKRYDNDEIEDKNGDGPKIEMLEILFPQNFIFVTPK